MRPHGFSIPLLLTSVMAGMALTLYAKPAMALGECYPGAYISTIDGHNFVAFNTGRESAGYANWVVTERPWEVRVAEWVTQQSVAPWGPADIIGEVRAGLPWIEEMPWYYFFTPWDDFTICKQ